MQFTSVIAVLSLALAASANPMNVERTGKETPGQQAQDKCGNTATAKCCNQKNGIIGSCNVINGEAGLGFLKVIANFDSTSCIYSPYYVAMQRHSGSCLLPKLRITGKSMVRFLVNLLLTFQCSLALSTLAQYVSRSLSRRNRHGPQVDDWEKSYRACVESVSSSVNSMTLVPNASSTQSIRLDVLICLACPLAPM